MNRPGPLDVESSVVFGEHVLAIRLFAHLDPTDGIATLFNVGNLRRRVTVGVESLLAATAAGAIFVSKRRPDVG